MTHPVETYFKTLHAVHATGGAVAETSYYPALAALLDEVEAKLKPKVRCVSQVKNTGAGSPDFGLYAANQFERAKDDAPMEGVLPERGVIEVKGVSDDSWVTAEGEQVTKYFGHYRQVLVTNYRDFVLVGQDADGKQAKLETLRLSDSATEFWASTGQPRKYAQATGDRLIDFLRMAMLHTAPLATPEDVAWALAYYAREARNRIEGSDLPALASLKKALEDALGMTFRADRDRAKQHAKEAYRDKIEAESEAAREIAQEEYEKRLVKVTSLDKTIRSLQEDASLRELDVEREVETTLTVLKQLHLFFGKVRDNRLREAFSSFGVRMTLWFEKVPYGKNRTKNVPVRGEIVFSKDGMICLPDEIDTVSSSRVDKSCKPKQGKKKRAARKKSSGTLPKAGRGGRYR